MSFVKRCKAWVLSEKVYGLNLKLLFMTVGKWLGF